MPTVAELTDPLLGTYTQVLPVGPGVCNVCHGAPGSGYARCFSCTQSTRQVSRPIELVVPVSLTALLGQLHHSLRSYKQPSYPHQVRAKFGIQVGALLARFLATHGDCIRRASGSDWDCITIVPSSQGRAGAHPLEDALLLFPSLGAQYLALLTPGDPGADHNRASDMAYLAKPEADGLRVLLVDDTFTSGARMQSAASALQLSGASVVAAVPVGRVVNPGFNTESAALLAAARTRPFDFGVCCLHE